jgi:hypothetical protein
LGLAAQLARILLTEVGHGEPDDRVDRDLGEVREVTFDARALRVAVSPARSGSFNRIPPVRQATRRIGATIRGEAHGDGVADASADGG